MIKKGVLALGLYLVGLGIYGFYQYSQFHANFKTFHNIDHVLTGLLALWFYTKSEHDARLIARVLSGVYLALTTESYVGHNGVFEIHSLGHLIVAALFLVIAFMPLTQARMVEQPVIE